MPRTRAALAAVWLIAACTNTGDGRPRVTPVVALPHLEAELADVPDKQDHSSDVASQGSARDDRVDPWDPASSARVDEAAVAADEILRLFELEDLFVLDLQTVTATADDTTAAVKVRVLYGTGRGHPAEATYHVELDLIERVWTVTSVEAMP